MATPRPDSAARSSDPEVEGFLALLAARRAPKTVEAYQRDLRALGDWLGGPPSKAPPADPERWLAGLRAPRLSPAPIARRVGRVRPLFPPLVPLGPPTPSPPPALRPPRPRPPVPRQATSAGALPQRPGRGAHARGRLPDPAPARRPCRPRAGAGPPAPAATFLRHAPARRRRRPAQRAGDAGSRRPQHD